MNEVKSLEDFKRFELTDDGACGDPECCGPASYYMEVSEKGEYVKYKHLRKYAIERVKQVIKESGLIIHNDFSIQLGEAGMIYDVGKVVGIIQENITFFNITMEELK